MGRVPTVPIGSAAPCQPGHAALHILTAPLKSAQIKFITLLEQATSYNKTDKKKGSPQFQTRTRHTILEKSLNFSTLDVNVNVHI